MKCVYVYDGVKREGNGWIVYFVLTCEARCESSQLSRQMIRGQSEIQPQWPHVHFKDRSPAFNIGRSCVGKTDTEAEAEEKKKGGREMLYHPDEDNEKHLLRNPQEPQCLQNSSRCTLTTSLTLVSFSHTLALHFPCPEQECSTKPAVLEWGKAFCIKR